MRAAFITGYGSNQKFVIGEQPNPNFGDNDILVEVRASSINPLDYKIRDGQLRLVKKTVFPFIPGHDCAGVVVKCGKNVSRFKVGDFVFAMPNFARVGGLAEFIAIDQHEAALMPRNLSFEEAASIPLVGLTCWQALIETANIKAGDRVLVHAGAGGVGSLAIQLAKSRGAKVFTTCSKKNEDFVRTLGADEVCDYQTQDFTTMWKDLDLVLDTVGGPTLHKSFTVVKSGGLIISIAGDPDANFARAMGLGMFKSWLIKMAGKKSQDLAKKYSVNYRYCFVMPSGEMLGKIAELISSGKIKANVGRVHELKDAQAAMDLSASGHAKGKIVVKIKAS